MTITTGLAQRLAALMQADSVPMSDAWGRLLDAMEAKDKQITELRQLIAELEASHAKLRGAMAAIHNTIKAGGAYTPLAAILNASKRAYEESAKPQPLEARTEQQSACNPVLAYADSYRDMARQGAEHIQIWSVITDLERNIAPLFTAPQAPAPVTVKVPSLNPEMFNADVMFGYRKARIEDIAFCAASGIKIAEGE